MSSKKTTKRNQQAPAAPTAPAPIQVDQPAVVVPATGKAATPEQKEKTKHRLHWVPEGGDRSLCGIFALDPRMITADAKEDVTCAVCLKALSATGGKKREKAERVTIQCVDCGYSREIFASQVGIVTRCEVCQKRYRRRKGAAKRRERTKARKAEKRLSFKGDVLAHKEDAQILLEEHKGDKAMLQAIIECAKAMLKG